MPGSSDVVQRWLALWNGDTAELEPLVAEAIVTHAVLMGQAAETPMFGRAALGEWIAATRATMPDLSFSIEVGPLMDGAMIAVRWRAQGRHGSAEVSFTGTDILRTMGGRIVEYWVNADVVLMMQQAGLLPSFEP